MDGITLGAAVVGEVKVVIFKVLNYVATPLDRRSIEQLDKATARLAAFFSSILRNSSRS